MSGLTPGAGDDFVARFLDDYFAECEEHFAIVRGALLALEGAFDDPARQAGLLDDLFRSFHSLKGISAMVDVRDAERLAHELEGYLRRLRDGELRIAPDALSVLIDGTAVLEGVVVSRRSSAPAPAIDEVVQRLASITAQPGLSGGDSPAAGAGPAREHDGPATWRITFTPSPALVERGVKVDSIRSRLGTIGRITNVAPRVSPEGGIAFDFILAGPPDGSVFEPWAGDGLTWTRVSAADIAAAGSAPGDSGDHARRGAAPEHSILAPSHVVRVDLNRLDDVMRRVADLVVTRARLEDSLARTERLIPAQQWRALQEITLAFERQLRDLREDVMRVRLVRVDEIFRRMPFVARDIARGQGKEVRVVLKGQDTEIDKFLVERMMDPVLHLVRNAVSHGIETADRRRDAGKPAEGTVTLSASTSGEMVLLEIADDGGGIDADAVAARARAGGARVPEGPLDSRELIDLICEPGLSTRDEADRASGRGIGMSVVRTTVHELGGSLAVDSTRGAGARFLITLPLTLAITDALVAVTGGHRFVVPQNSVHEVIEIDEALVRQIEDNELVPFRGHSLPLLRLASLFGLDTRPSSRSHAFVIGTGQDAVALGVDRVLGQREIVVRAMPDALLKVDGISGATELGDGRVVLILDAAALSRMARQGSNGRQAGRRAASAGGRVSTGAVV